MSRLLPRDLGIGRRVIFVCLALYVIVAALLEIAELLSVSREVKASIDARTLSLADQNIPALSRAVWNFEGDMIDLILAGIANDSSVGKVELKDERGQSLVVHYSPDLVARGAGAPAEEGMLGRPRTFALPYVSEEAKALSLGTLTIYPSLISQRERERQSLLLSIGRTAAVLILLSLVLFMTIERFLGKPLRAMARQIAAINPDEPGSVRVVSPPGAGGELALVSGALNAMALRIGETMYALHESERRIWSTFEDSPISIWDEDFSRVKTSLDALRAGGQVDWRSFFAPEERVIEFNSLVRVRDVNRTTLRLFGMADKSLLLSGLPVLRDRVQIEMMRQEFIAFAGGETTYEGETDYARPDGRLVEMQIKVSIVPGSENSWDHVVASVMDITEQKAAERFLVQSLQEKELLLRELHHRVKNNLQIVSSIVSLQRGEEGPASPVSRSLLDIESRVWSMSLVHELLYENDNFAFLDFSAYTHQLCEHLVYSYISDPRRVRLTCEIDPNARLPLERAVPLGLIINELVVNSLKYAFSDGRPGELRVALTREGDRLRLLVADDGPGFGEAASRGAADREGVGLGLVEGLAAQLGGKHSVESNGGTRVAVVFPG